MAGDNFGEVFQRLRMILAKHAPPLVVTADSAVGFSIATDRPDVPPERQFVGGVTPRKAYVSFYFMPVYISPELLQGISPELRKRMQGKSCFNFKKVDEDLLAEMDALVTRGLEHYAPWQ